MIENESLNRLHLVEDIMYLVNTYPEIKKVKRFLSQLGIKDKKL